TSRARPSSADTRTTTTTPRPTPRQRTRTRPHRTPRTADPPPDPPAPRTAPRAGRGRVRRPSGVVRGERAAQRREARGDDAAAQLRVGGHRLAPVERARVHVELGRHAGGQQRGG